MLNFKPAFSALSLSRGSEVQYVNNEDTIILINLKILLLLLCLLNIHMSNAFALQKLNIKHAVGVGER